MLIAPSMLFTLSVKNRLKSLMLIRDKNNKMRLNRVGFLFRHGSIIYF
jgi:hypothetical protein